MYKKGKKIQHHVKLLFCIFKEVGRSINLWKVVFDADLGSQSSEATGYEGEVRYPWNS